MQVSQRSGWCNKRSDSATDSWIRKPKIEVQVINTSYGNPVKLNEGLKRKIYARNKTNLHLVFHIFVGTRSQGIRVSQVSCGKKVRRVFESFIFLQATSMLCKLRIYTKSHLKYAYEVSHLISRWVWRVCLNKMWVKMRHLRLKNTNDKH